MGTARRAAARSRSCPGASCSGRAAIWSAPSGGKPGPVVWRLDRIAAPALGTPGAAPEDFDLDAYAARSFMTFQEPPHTIVLRFTPDAMPDAARFRFHPSQEVETLEDGSLRVRFTCGGLLQVAHHLFTWGGAVRIEAPDVLRETMDEALAAAAASVEASAGGGAASGEGDEGG